MAKFNVGDRVLSVQAPVGEYHQPSGVYFNEKMEQTVGKIGTVKSVWERQCGTTTYNVEFEMDEGAYTVDWYYVPEWLSVPPVPTDAEKIEALEAEVKELKTRNAMLNAQLWDANATLIKIKEIVQ